MRQEQVCSTKNRRKLGGNRDRRNGGDTRVLKERKSYRIRCMYTCVRQRLEVGVHRVTG